MTSEFLKKPSSLRRIPSTAPASHYLGTLRVLDQKPSQKQNTEPDRADNLRATVYQVKRKIFFKLELIYEMSSVAGYEVNVQKRIIYLYI